MNVSEHFDLCVYVYVCAFIFVCIQKRMIAKEFKTTTATCLPQKNSLLCGGAFVILE